MLFRKKVNIYIHPAYIQEFAMRKSGGQSGSNDFYKITTKMEITRR